MSSAAQARDTVRSQFGFLPDPTASAFRNAVRLASQPSLSLPLLPSNLAFHDLTADKIAPPEAKSLLGMGSTFIRKPEFTTGNISHTVDRFDRDMKLKVFFAGSENLPGRDNISKLYVKSTWTPQDFEIPPWVHRRLRHFFRKTQALFKKKKVASNLFPFQEKLLQDLLDHPTLLFPQTDKGLGPCAVEVDQYIEDCLIHLRDEQIYRQLTDQEATAILSSLETKIDAWLVKNKKSLTAMETKHIRHHMQVNASSPFGQFYVLYKIHKGQKNGRWPTRPVCSDVSSLPHGLGKWVTEKLLPIAQAQPSYFKDSFALKDLLDNMVLPENAMIFTADATAMYTNIPTEPALNLIAAYLRACEGTKFKHYTSDVLIDALHLVFQNNIFKFGDTTWQQTSGTGMGISPAPPWATIFYALHENDFVPRWKKYLHFYKRFIDDVFGVWLCDPCPTKNAEMWAEFQRDMQAWHGLEWTFTTPANSCNFMDLTVSITDDNTFSTTLFEKAQNLYLYIPPHSSHPKSIATGLIYGQVLRIRRLCSSPSDANDRIGEFFNRLLERGHSRERLVPLFTKAEINASQYLARSTEDHARLQLEKLQAARRKIFFHLTFHPDDPPSSAIQQLWKECVAEPPGETPLHGMANYDGEMVRIDQLIIAYNRPLNLRNQFSVRNISGRGKPVSEYLAK